MIRSDHPIGLKKGGVCVYYKEYIPFIRRDNLCTLNNCLVAELFLENEKCFLTCLYRLSSQTQHEFENFWTNLDFLIDNISNELLLVSVITGDLDTTCSKWCNKDIFIDICRKTNSVGCETGSLASSAEYKQLISKPTRIVNNSSACIDLIFVATRI